MSKGVQRSLAVIVLGLASFALFWLCTVVLPRRLAFYDLHSVKSLSGARRNEALKAIDNARGKFVQVGLGITVLLTAYVSWLRLRTSEREAAVARAQYALARETQLSQRL